MVEGVGEAIITIGETGVIESFNRAATQIFGYAPGEIIGQNITLLMPDAMRQSHQRGLARYLTTGEARVIGKQRVELPGLRKDGTVFDLELAVSAVRAGEQRYFVGIVRDITERKIAEAELFAEKERLRVTLGSIGDGVITTDLSGTVTYLNPVAEEMTGWKNADAIGQPFPLIFNIVNGDTRLPALNPVAVVLREQEVAGLAEETVLIHRDGFEFPIEDSASPIRDHAGKIVGVVLVFHDVSHARQMATRMTHQATHDALTGLINRPEFERRVALAIQSGALESKEHCMLYLDLDQFKIVNDTCGHIAGDELLRLLTNVLQGKLRAGDTLARLGGDEFGLLLDTCPLAPAVRIAEMIRQTVKDFRFSWGDTTFAIGVSIGVVTFGTAGTSVADILRMADEACYISKDMGRNRVHVYATTDEELIKRQGEMSWTGKIQRALDHDLFVLFSQQIKTLDAAVTEDEHFEMLIRMKSDTSDQLIPPGAFIPAAERYGLMPAIDRWTVRTALAYCARRVQEKNWSGLCAINLSGKTLCDEKFLLFVLDEFHTTKLDPARVCFEITETAAIGNLAFATVFMRQLKALGCKFSLDDFGSGMASFSYLKHLPVDYLKIDGGFVKDMLSDPIDGAMVEAINTVGHVMGILTIAEFVETQAIAERLRAIGVDYAQGYGIERPRPLEDSKPFGPRYPFADAPALPNDEPEKGNSPAASAPV